MAEGASLGLVMMEKGGHDAGAGMREFVVRGVDVQPLDLVLARTFAAELLALAPLEVLGLWRYIKLRFPRTDRC